MATTIWVLPQAAREIRRTRREDEITDMLGLLRDEGRVAPNWFHRETRDFDAFGPPGSAVRVYYARHAQQIVVLGASRRKRGRGKLSPEFARVLVHRLRDWRAAYPSGRMP